MFAALFCLLDFEFAIECVQIYETRNYLKRVNLKHYIEHMGIYKIFVAKFYLDVLKPAKQFQLIGCVII